MGSSNSKSQAQTNLERLFILRAELQQLVAEEGLQAASSQASCSLLESELAALNALLSSAEGRIGEEHAKLQALQAIQNLSSFQTKLREIEALKIFVQPSSLTSPSTATHDDVIEPFVVHALSLSEATA